MKKTKKTLIILYVVIVVSMVTPISAMATSPGPQTMTLVVINAPKGLEISIASEEALGEWFQARVSSRAWETHYQFYLSRESAGIWPYDDITILTNSKKYGEFEMTFPVANQRWFSYKLDLETRTVTQAYTHGRNLLIALCWLAPLFIAESIVFFSFGYRREKSWMIFALENFTMQGLFIGVWSILHIIINYNVFLLIFTLFLPLLMIPGIRIVKLVAEILIFRTNVLEHSKARTTACVVVMNIVGAIVVILLGIHLPLPAL